MRHSDFITIIIVIVVLLLASICSCSPKIIEHTTVQIEYRDRIVHDTATVTIPVEVEKVVTKDTVSHLENSFAKSDACVSMGLLSHSLESKPQYIKVPVEVHVTDTLYKESQVTTEIKEVEKKLTWFQKVRLDGFWWLLAVSLLLLVWIFRKPIMSLLKVIPL